MHQQINKIKGLSQLLTLYETILTSKNCENIVPFCTEILTYIPSQGTAALFKMKHENNS